MDGQPTAEQEIIHRENNETSDNIQQYGKVSDANTIRLFHSNSNRVHGEIQHCNIDAVRLLYDFDKVRILDLKKVIDSCNQ